MSNNLNINQFQQIPVEGDLDLQIASSQTISGIVSANQATALTAGMAVKLDSAITSGNVPQFVAAGQDDVAIGYVKRTVQASSFSAADKVEITGNFGPVMWMTAAGSIACGAYVEQDSTGALIQTYTSHSKRGLMLDPVSTGQLGRVIIMSPATSE